MKQFKSSVRIQIIWMIISNNLCKTIGFPDGSVVKNLPVMQEMWVRLLGQEDPQRRKWQLTPVFPPEEFHGQKSLEGYIQSMGVAKSRTWLSNITFLSSSC